MKKNMQGFTLIELMIVVAIIAILAAIALPAYQDFIKRSKVSEAVAATAACKTSVAEFVASNNAFPGSADAAGCSALTSQYTGALTVAAGVITIPVAGIAGDVTGNIILTPDATEVANGRVRAWTCSTTITQKYVPSSCRTAAAPAP